MAQLTDKGMARLLDVLAGGVQDELKAVYLGGNDAVTEEGMRPSLEALQARRPDLIVDRSPTLRVLTCMRT